MNKSPNFFGNWYLFALIKMYSLWASVFALCILCVKWDLSLTKQHAT